LRFVDLAWRCVLGNVAAVEASVEEPAEQIDCEYGLAGARPAFDDNGAWRSRRSGLARGERGFEDFLLVVDENELGLSLEQAPEPVNQRLGRTNPAVRELVEHRLGVAMPHIPLDEF